MLKLDPRIKDRSVIKTVLDVDKSFVGKVGYFADCLYELTDLKECHHGKITDVIESGETDLCFKYDYYGDPLDSRCFIADEDLLPAKEEYRPFTIEEFTSKFDVGDVVRFRHKPTTDKGVFHPQSIRALVDSIEYYCVDPLIRIRARWYSLKTLFEEYELWNSELGWIPFGIKVNE